jgi:hypothetical protein
MYIYSTGHAMDVSWPWLAGNHTHSDACPKRVNPSPYPSIAEMGDNNLIKGAKNK